MLRFSDIVAEKLQDKKWRFFSILSEICGFFVNES